MDPREELAALRRMAELEAKALSAGSPRPAESVVAAQPPAQSAQNAWDAASIGDIAAGLPVTRMAAGIAAPVVGALQAGANIGDWIAEKMGQDPVLGKYIAEKVGEYEASKKRGMAALGDAGADVAGFVGSMATGGAAVKNIAPAATYLGRIGQGAAIGAGAGATTPSATSGISQTLEQAGTGAALGGGIPAVAPVLTKGGKVVYRTVLEPLVDRTAIKGRAYMEAAGAKAPEVIRALRASKPVVPGSMPTAGEAAAGVGRAEFSALQKNAEKILPSEYLARSDARSAARLNQLGQVAGTEADMAAAQALRKFTAKRNYAKAEAQGIDQQMAEALQPQIESLMSRPSIQKAKDIAVKLARENDIVLSDFGSVAGLDWVKKGLDAQISSAAKASSSVSASELAALMQTKSDLLATLEQIAPAYNVARKAYAKQSTPINKMEVGQYLKGKLTAALDEAAPQKAVSFAGAVRDASGTLKRALTGAPRYDKLTDVLSDADFKKVEAIRKDLANTARQELMAQKGAQAGPNAMDTASQSISSATGGGRIPNPLSRVVTIANAIIARLEGRIDKKLAIELATEMLEPKAVALAMQKEVKKAKVGAAKAASLNKLRPTATAASTNALTQGTE